MNLNELAQTIWAQLHELAITPLAEFFRGLDQGELTVLSVLLSTAAAIVDTDTQEDGAEKLARLYQAEEQRSVVPMQKASGG